MKTPEEIKKGLGWCSRDTTICTETCPYYGSLSNGVECASELQADALAYIQQLERERDAAVADLESVDEKYESLKSMIDDVTFNHEPYGLYLDFREAADAMVEHEHADVWRDVKNTRTGASDSCTGASGV